jgi:hypothetical protein
VELGLCVSAASPRDDGKPHVVHAEEKLAAFLELEVAIRTASRGRTPLTR